jgi:hypothetical protein
MLAGHFLVENPGPLEERIASGAKVRLLLANPCDDEHMCTLVSRCDPMTEGYTDDLQRDIKRAVRKLVGLQQSVKKNGYPGSLEFKFQGIVPPFGMFGIDPDSPKGIIKVEMYPYLTPIPIRPHFFLKRDRDGEWYDIFRSQFEEQWEIAVSFDSIKNRGLLGWGDLSDV